MSQFNEFETTLKKLRSQLLERIESIALDTHHRDNPLDPDFEEQAVERQNEEVLDALDEAGRKELIQINNALDRIVKGTYNTCEECGAEIGTNRLKAVPYTNKCIDCAE